MVKFFQTSLNGKIVNAIVVSEEKCLDADNNFDESIGKEFCESMTNIQSDLWVSEPREELPNRKGEPAINGYYLEDVDCFKGIQPFSNWTYSTSTGMWEAPVTKPAGDQLNYVLNDETLQYEYIFWDEDTQRWYSKKNTDPRTFVYWDPTTSTWIDFTP